MKICATYFPRSDSDHIYITGSFPPVPLLLLAPGQLLPGVVVEEGVVFIVQVRLQFVQAAVVRAARLHEVSDLVDHSFESRLVQLIFGKRSGNYRYKYKK